MKTKGSILIQRDANKWPGILESSPYLSCSWHSIVSHRLWLMLNREKEGLCSKKGGGTIIRRSGPIRG